MIIKHPGVIAHRRARWRGDPLNRKKYGPQACGDLRRLPRQFESWPAMTDPLGLDIRHPAWEQVPQLRALWKQAFADTDAFLDAFFTEAFAPERCLCAWDGEPCAMVYWFSMEAYGQKYAYLYAGATEKSHRGKGIFPALLRWAHRLLEKEGYAGTVLMPAPGLEDYYSALGYVPFGGVRETEAAGGKKLPVRLVSPEEFAHLRPLADGGLALQGPMLRFLYTQADFYAGEGFTAAVSREAPGYLLEYLGEEAELPGLICALGLEKALVRTPGKGRLSGMFRPLRPDAQCPTWLGFPLD